MLDKGLARLLAAGMLAMVVAHPAGAQQTLNVSIGYFTPRGEDARTSGDVLVANRTFLTFEFGEFSGPALGVEWLFALHDRFEGGIGLSFSRRTVPSVYSDFVASDGSEIEQELRLRLVPIAFTVRLTPLGPASAVQPYIGGGLAIINWRYSESGEFIDFRAGRVLFRDRFVADGNTTGPVALGGVRFVSTNFSAGFEIRFHGADDDLDERFAGPTIDLGGWTYQGTVGVRF
jgi:hypothetical protein